MLLLLAVLHAVLRARIAILLAEATGSYFARVAPRVKTYLSTSPASCRCLCCCAAARLWMLLLLPDCCCCCCCCYCCCCDSGAAYMAGAQHCNENNDKQPCFFPAYPLLIPCRTKVSQGGKSCPGRIPQEGFRLLGEANTLKRTTGIMQHIYAYAACRDGMRMPRAEAGTKRRRTTVKGPKHRP